MYISIAVLLYFPLSTWRVTAMIFSLSSTKFQVFPRQPSMCTSSPLCTMPSNSISSCRFNSLITYPIISGISQDFPQCHIFSQHVTKKPYYLDISMNNYCYLPSWPLSLPLSLSPSLFTCLSVCPSVCPSVYVSSANGCTATSC